jgi:hypothetical protein
MLFGKSSSGIIGEASNSSIVCLESINTLSNKNRTRRFSYSSG